MHVCISMQLSEGLISVFVPFFADLYWGSKKVSGDGDAADNPEQPLNSVGLICKDFILKSREGNSWCSRSLSRHWPCHERLPHSLDAPIPTKAFWHIRCPPRLQGRAETMASSLLCLMSSYSSSAHTGGLALIIPATRFVLFLSRRSCMILLFSPPLWKRLKNLVHEFAEHQAEVWPPRCNTNIETVRNGPKYSCMFRKTFRQLVESYRCH